MTISRRRVVACALAVTFAGVHGTVLSGLRAQELGRSPLRVSPLFSTTQVYDSNLFSTSVAPQGDFITRVSPGIESEYRSARFSLLGHYVLDLERFAAHPELTSADGRQQASIDLHTSRSRRLAFAVDGTFARTRTPGELSAGTGLTLARADRRTRGGASGDRAAVRSDHRSDTRLHVDRRTARRRRLDSCAPARDSHRSTRLAAGRRRRELRPSGVSLRDRCTADLTCGQHRLDASDHTEGEPRASRWPGGDRRRAVARGARVDALPPRPLGGVDSPTPARRPLSSASRASSIPRASRRRRRTVRVRACRFASCRVCSARTAMAGGPTQVGWPSRQSGA